MSLDLPLDKISEGRVSGDYRFAGNTLDPGYGAPLVEQFAGQLVFAEHSVSLREASGRVLGMPTRFTVDRAERRCSDTGDGTGRRASSARAACQPWVECDLRLHGLARHVEHPGRRVRAQPRIGSARSRIRVAGPACQGSRRTARFQAATSLGRRPARVGRPVDGHPRCRLSWCAAAPPAVRCCAAKCA